MNNLNKTRSIKYGFIPNQVEEKDVENSSFVELHNVHKLVRVNDNKDSIVRYKERKDNYKNRKLRCQLDIEEKVLVITEGLKKKDSPGNVYKSMTENKHFLKRDMVFTINKKVLAENEDAYYYYHWLKENDGKVNGGFYRHEEFALRDQTV